ncbi:hypothetical protein SORBI_3005G110529 [Sorghum bicolor]|uniref:Uncharacterized protein n=1 Tax=Sorghum bicolor TaxID=4558 RepID=A0A120GUQ1_SORBI|nr:hypothetical protein SORBI_3005G110529 [Sorghum bicolor]
MTVNIIREDKPDITEVRVLLPDEALSPLQPGSICVCIYNEVIDDQVVMITPAPYIG